MTLTTENRQKYQHYHLEKLLNINISEVKTYCLLIKNKIIEQAKLANSLYGKHLKSKQKNDLTRVKLEEIANLRRYY